MGLLVRAGGEATASTEADTAGEGEGVLSNRSEGMFVNEQTKFGLGD